MKMRKINKKGQKGFTLVEVLISASIITITIVGMLGLFTYTSRLAELAGDKVTVLNIAQDKMDEIRNTAFGSIASTYPSGTTFALSAPLTGTGTITLDTSVGDIIGVTVSVSWVNTKGRGSTITLVSKVANR